MANSIGKVQIDFVAGLGQLTSGLAGISSQVGGLERNVQQSTRLMSNAFNSLKGAIAGVGLLAIARQAVQTADSFANITARLKLTTGAAQDFGRTFANVVDIAQRTSTSLEETANLYGRISKSLTDLGRDGAQAGGIVETINQTLALSGASAQSSAAAIQQLNQALASGVLRGEEFNSVSEQAPLLLDAIARATGKTIGELRALAQEGKLSASVVISSLQQQAEVINGQFAQLPLTAGRAFQQLRNASLVAFGELGQGLSEGLGAAISDLAQIVQSIPMLIKDVSAFVEENFNAIAAAAVLAGSVIASQFAGAALGAAIAALKSLGAALLTGIANIIFYTNVMGAATAANAAFGTSSAAAGSSLLAFVGGPVGAAVLALGGLSAAIFFLRDSETAAEKSARSLQTATEDLQKAQGAGIAVTLQSADAKRQEAKESLNAAVAALKLLEAERQRKLASLQNARGEAGLSVAGGSLALQDAIVSDAQKQIDKLVQSLIELDTASTNADLRQREFAAQVKAGAPPLIKFGASADDAKKAIAELNRQIENGVDSVAKYRAELNPLGSLADQQASEFNNFVKALKAGKVQLTDLEILLKGQEEAYRKASIEAEETARATTELSLANKNALKPVTDLINSLETEEAILRAQLAGRTDLVAALLAEARVREVLAQIPDELRGQVDPEKLREQLQLNEALKEQVQLVQSLRAAYADAFGDLAAGIGDIGDFFESLGNTTRRYFSDLISNAIKSGKSIKEIFADLNKNSIAQNGLNLQNAGQLVGSVASGIQAYRNRDTVGFISSAAQAGATVGGATGATIATIVAAVVSIFRSNKPPDLRLGGIGNTRKPEQTFTTALGSFQVGARGLEGKENEFVDLVKQFDASLSSIVGSFRDGQSQLGIVQAALQRFAIDLKGDAVTAENVLGARFGAILATFNADVQAFVGAAGTVEERVQRLADASFIDAAAAAGKLVDTFSDLASIIKTQQVAGESAAQTYARVAGATALLESALDLTGANIELGRIAFVNLATDIVDAAGGLERASQLWNAYYETFYSDTERAVALQAAASRNLTDELADVGLGPGTTKEQFRAIFESLLPTLTPEQIAQYLEAAEAFAQMDAALGDVTETVSDLNAIAIATPEQLASALESYRNFQQGIKESLEDLGATEFQRSLNNINREFEQNTRRANELAQAAGLAGATQEDLADIQLLASRRIEQAIAALRQRIATLANSLYGPLARITRQIAERQAEISASSSLELGAIQQVADASANRYEAELQALKQIAGFLDSLKLDTALTTLTPQQRVSEAQGQFERLLARARGGDTEALQQLSGAAQAYLREARGFFASGSQYTTIFDFVTQALAALGPTQSPGGIGAGVVGGGGQVDTQLAFLESERERLTRDQERVQRQAQVLELIGFLRELSQATSTNILELAGSFEIPLAQLVTDLGVNLDDLSVSTAVTLAGIANQLGVELTDLAQSVGIDLGSLADDQSLLNDALEQVISGLPPESAAALKPLLQAVEDATTEADANEAIQNLTLAALAQPVAIRNQLAPFLDGLDLAGSLTDLDYLEQVAAKGLETAENTYTATLLLTEIRDLISSNPEPLTPIPIVPPEEPESVSASFAAGVTVLAGKLDKLAERVGGVEKAQATTAQAIRLQTDEMTKRR